MIDGSQHAGTLEPPAVGSPESIPDEALRTELAALVETQVTIEPLPEPTDLADGRTIRKTARKVAPPPATTRLLVRRQKTETTVIVDGRGLARRHVTGDAVAVQIGGWRAATGQPSWALAGWNPVPKILFTAELDRWQAAIAAVGGFALLGVRNGEEPPVWHRIGDDRVEDLHRGALGALVRGPNTLTSVIAMPAGARLHGPVIVRAELLERRVSYHHSEAEAGNAIVSAAEALALLTPDTPPTAPHAENTLLPQLVTELLRLVDGHGFGQSWVRIGQRVEETWRLLSGHTITTGYDVPGGTVQGHLLDAVTGRPLRSAYACRAHHLVDLVSRCATCRTDTCAACHDSVRPCVLCTGGVCAGCLADADGRCTACAALKKVGMFRRSRFGASITDAVWHGTGPNVEVTVRRVKDAWFLDRCENNEQVTTPLAGETLMSVQRLLR
ncbi:hypothetical protein [Actinoplanes sp. NPDC049802]|uniref:hypothetical protein n=1 Tax=Actinoplanes sp. NPDC049802 TaxID=3154742 RepID=UPI0034108F63